MIISGTKIKVSHQRKHEFQKTVDTVWAEGSSGRSRYPQNPFHLTRNLQRKMTFPSRDEDKSTLFFPHIFCDTSIQPFYTAILCVRAAGDVVEKRRKAICPCNVVMKYSESGYFNLGYQKGEQFSC
ncbi:Hypothetical protein NTJ_05740 [Nesidiocoris tenuis]|uniref:Uncharacterized protein n=1 Tax=Nesidiocoris tenuis TaxID=355587 RepID=A0ABN7AL22_9HEMI|nr:Hypothetical protein NTJ_05740 [Nesidiocoris tenuis]